MSILLRAVLLLVTAVIALICLILALRCFSLSSVTLGRRTLSLEKPMGLEGESFTRSMFLRAGLWALGVLAAYYFLSFLHCAIDKDSVSWAAIQDAWIQWDANNYLRIAELGYGGYTEAGMHTTLVFFPLYPWLMRLLHTVIPNYLLCGHLLSAVSFIAGCVMLARLVTEDFGWPTGRTSLLLLSAYPFSFFFAACYPEALFLALSVTAFYCIRRHRWLLAGIFSALAAMTRMQGAVLACAGVAEYLAAEAPLAKIKARDWRGLWRDLWQKLLPLSIVLVGVGVYLAVNYIVDGNPFQFLIYQKQIWAQGFSPLPSCLRTIWEYFVGNWGKSIMATTWGPDLAVFVFCLGALAYAARRMSPAWLTYFLACVLLNYSLSWPLSCGRYIACAFPLFVTLAAACRRRPGAGWLLAFVWALIQGLTMPIYLSGGHVL